MIAIGIDIGGSKTRVGAASADDPYGTLLASRDTATGDQADCSALLNWIVDAVDELTKEATTRPAAPADALREQHACLAGAGLALPGILDRSRRRLVRSVNVGLLEDRPVCDELAERIGCPVRLVTDADAATWAEYVAYARSVMVEGRPSPGLTPGGSVRVRDQAVRRFVHLRIGTGVGCGLVVGGELQGLEEHRTGHLDVLRIDTGPGAARCPCGKTGCLETAVTRKALHERALRVGFADGLDGLQSAWDRGDSLARSIVDEAAEALTIALTNLIERFNADVVSTGGGAAAALPGLLEQARRHLSLRNTHRNQRVASAMIPAVLGDAAGVIGAALLARHAFPTTV